MQSVGASAEFGNIQGAVFNVVTRQGGNRFHLDLSYYGQPAGLTSRPIVLDCPDCDGGQSGYERATLSRHHGQRRWADPSRSALVLRRRPVSAQRGQSAGHRPGAPAHQ